MRSRSCLVAVVVLVGLGTAGCGGGDGDGAASTGRTAAPAAAAERAADGGTLARVPEIYRKLEPSVVAVQVEGRQGSGEGSGVVYEPRRIVTNHHVVAGAGEIEVVLADGDRIPARVVASDPRTDLALLAVDRDLPPASFATSVPPVGSLAVAIGNPLGFEGSVTAGVLSGVDRAVPSEGQTPALVNLLQTDAPISPGNSGGALVGQDGKVIGINVAYIAPVARAVSIGFAIPSPTVVDIVRQLAEDGEVDHAFLGVKLRPLTSAVAEQLQVDAQEGVIVAAVEPRGPADRAGLRAGDIIVEAGERPVSALEDVFSALRRTEPGDTLTLTVIRDGDRRDVRVQTGRRPPVTR
ncbi:MAG: trypsin-like peptidase domain-containing protein [Actinobacteria bacterium]|nr:trypsin-like peptidase domain-containing protein [Actinomycetota bacterium]